MRSRSAELDLSQIVHVVSMAPRNNALLQLPFERLFLADIELTRPASHNLKRSSVLPSAQRRRSAKALSEDLLEATEEDSIKMTARNRAWLAYLFYQLSFKCLVLWLIRRKIAR